MEHDVFISYSSVNAQVAQAVCHALEEAGIRCWIAPRNIRPGADYADCIDAAINSCKVFVLVFSETAQLSKWVKAELNIAFDGNKAIIPFRIDPTSLSGAMRLILNDKHWLDAFPQPSAKFAELTRVVSGILSSPSEYTSESVSYIAGGQSSESSSSFGKTLLKKIFPSLFANKLRIRSNRPARLYINGEEQGIIEEESTQYFEIADDSYSVEVFSKDYGKNAILRFEGNFDKKNPLLNIDMRQCEMKYLLSRNDSDSINSVGLEYYSQGKFNEAYQYFVRAARMGEGAALYNLGLMYHFGRGVAKDFDAARDFYEQACENQYPLAYNNLGSLYYNGQGVAVDKEMAFGLFLKGAERGVEVSQFSVASMLYHGDGVKVDKATSKMWFEKAAAQGSEEARKYLDAWV